MNSDYQAIIIGGGPAGSTAATVLARAGHRVLVLEKEVFPRFHVGESLLPYNRRLFEILGLEPMLQAAGFVPKRGAQFHLGNGSKHMRFVFAQGRYTREPQAIQVERATFDHLLLQHAASCGAEVRQGWTVHRTAPDRDGVTVSAQGPDGKAATWAGSFLIDASGRGNLTGNQEGLRKIHPDLRKVALYAHFAGVARDEGPSGGDTVIVRLQDKWFWLIPVSQEKTSVGCVLDQSELARDQRPHGEIFEKLWQSSPVMRQRLGQAQALTPIRVASDFSYVNRRLVGPRLLRVGDAAGFMDPIFSAGVYLAMHSGHLAAEAVSESLRLGDQGTRRLKRYEKRMRRAMWTYWRMVRLFYTTPFMEIFLEPREVMGLPSAVNALLAGELEGGWSLRWRLGMFLWLVRLQRYVPLVPRISFAEQRS